jgi:hypothetical protein
MGFFTESYREYFGDRSRENENIQSLLKDIRNDSLILKGNSFDIINQNKGLDSLISALRQPLSLKKNLQYAYIMYIKYGQVSYHVFFSEGSISQMINSGSLRIIRNGDLVHRINQYQNIKLSVRKFEDLVINLEGQIEQNQANKVFDFTAPSKLNKLIDSVGADMPVDSLIKIANQDNMVFLNDNPLIIASLRNNLKSIKGLNETYLYWIEGASTINNKMISE